jgi:protein-disulfide isomerase
MRGAARVNRRYIVGAIVAALVVVGVLVGLSLAGGDDDDGASPESLQGVQEVQRELQGIPQDGIVLGRPDAPVTIVEFADISCPACASFATTTLPTVIDRWVRPGDAKLEFRPIAFINTSSERGALGALAAGRQDTLWQFVEVAYRNQGPEDEDWFTEDLMTTTVERLGMDVDQWRSDFEGDAVVSEFFEHETAASEGGVRLTPTFQLSGPGGERELTGAVGLSEFEEAITAVAAR